MSLKYEAVSEPLHIPAADPDRSTDLDSCTQARVMKELGGERLTESGPLRAVNLSRHKWPGLTHEMEPPHSTESVASAANAAAPHGHFPRKHDERFPLLLKLTEVPLLL